MKPVAGRSVALFWALGMLVLSMTVAPPLVSANNSPSRQTLTKIDTTTVKKFSTFYVEREAIFTVSPDQFSMLMHELDLTATLVRAWELERYRASRLDHEFFEVDDGAGLTGRVLRVHEQTGHLIYVGKGHYESSRLPLVIKGTALADIQWKGKRLESDTGTKMKATLYARIDNVALHLMSKVLYPIIKSVANDKTDHLITVATHLATRLKNQPTKTRQRLKKIDPELLPQLDQK